MDRNRVLLLSCAAKLRHPVSALLIEDRRDFAQWFQVPHHRLSPGEVGDALESMLCDGDLAALRGNGVGFAPTRAQIDRALGEALETGEIYNEATFYFGLTAQGGRAWEEAARPNWSRFTIICGAPGGGEEVACADRARVQKYLDTRMFAVASPQWQVLAPWQATYWKQLPQAYRVRFRDGALRKRLRPPVESRRSWWKWFDDPA